MRCLIFLVALIFPQLVLADCPAPGHLIAGVVYDDGTTVDKLTINGDVVETSVKFPDGTSSIFTAKYGVYYEKLTSDDEMVWTWATTDLVPPAMLPVETETAFDVVIDQKKGFGPVELQYILVSHGMADLAVGDCKIPVILLDQHQIFPEGGGRFDSKLWLDPESMVILKSERKKIDASGKVEAERNLMAVELKL